MGMFDEMEPFKDHFQEGQKFTLEAARMGPEIQTEYGKSPPAMLKIAGKWYSLFGQGLANQIARMENGDLPAEVKLARRPTRSGQQVKLLVPADAPDDDIPF